MAANTHSADFESGSSQYANIASGSYTGLGIVGNQTIANHINFESLPTSGNAMLIAEMRVAISNRGAYLWQLKNDGGTLKFSFFHRNSSDQTDEILANWTPSTGTWYHIAVTISGTTVQFYVDAATQGSSGTLTNTREHDAGSDFEIATLEGTGSFLDAKVDEMVITSDALNIAELSKLEQGYDAGFLDNLQAYWKFNNSWADSSGNDNTLSPQASPVFSTTVPFSNYVSVGPASRLTLLGVGI